MSSRVIDQIVKNLSTSCTKQETRKLRELLKNPVIMKKFEDPLTARQKTSSFKSPEFKMDFFEDPLTAINKVNRRATDPQPDIPRKI